MDLVKKEDYKCPWCHSHISKEKYDKLVQENKDLKKQIEKSKNEAEKYKQLSEQTKKDITELNRKHKEELKSIEKSVRSSERKKLGDKMNAMHEEIKRLKEGKTAQEVGFDYEKELYEMFRNEFSHDIVEKTGKLGDILIKVKSKGNIVGTLLIELKKVMKHSEAHIEEVKRHQDEAKADFGILVTNGDFGRTRMDGIKIIEDIIVIRPNSVMDLIKIIRKHLIEIDSLKISKEEKEKERLKLWNFIHSAEFESQMVAIFRDINRFKQIDVREMKLIEKRNEIEENMLKAHEVIIQGIKKTREAVMK